MIKSLTNKMIEKEIVMIILICTKTAKKFKEIIVFDDTKLLK